MAEVLILDREGKSIRFDDPLYRGEIYRVSGYREWDSPEAIASIEAVLAKH